MFNSKIDKLKLYFLIIFVIQIGVILLFDFVLKIDHNFLIYIYMLIFAIEITYFFIFYEFEKCIPSSILFKILYTSEL